MNYIQYSLTESIEKFKSAMSAEGLTPPDTIIPGKLHRFPGKRKGPSNKSGWSILFEDLKGGSFGDFSSDLDIDWQIHGDEKYSPEEREIFRQRCTAERELRTKEQQQRYAASVAKAKELLNSATGDISTHPYAVLKKVALGSLIKRGAWPQRGWYDALLIPLYDKNGEIRTLQAINIDSEKNLLKDGLKKGCFYPFGKIRGADKVFIGEGVATVAAVYDATNTPAVAAMDASNLYDVALVIRELAPKAEIVLLADNDISEDGKNVGVEAAIKAAQAVSGTVAIPEMDGKKCDFWDLWAEQGPGAIKESLEKAIAYSLPEINNTYPEPLPLPKLPPVPDFPAEILPDIFIPWLSDAAHRACYPMDFAAVISMAALGSLIGRQLGIRLKQKDDWTEHANVWGMIVGAPSTLKSPAMREGMGLLKNLQTAASQRYQEETQDYNHQLELSKLKKTVKKHEIRKKLEQNHETEIDFSDVPLPSKPIERVYWTSDITAEKLGEILAENPNGLLVERDELSSLLTNLEDEKHATARSLYLSGWSGNDGYRFDRISRGTTTMEKFALSIIGGIQPGPLAKYVRKAFAGERADGLLQRFQLAVWPDAKGFEYVDKEPDSGAKNKVIALFSRIDQIILDLKNSLPQDSSYIHLSTEAQMVFIEWYSDFMLKRQEIENNGKECPAICAHFGKYPGLIGKLALIIHIADDPTATKISEKTLRKALGWIDYLTPHAMRLYHAAEHPETHTAELLLSRLRAGQLPDKFKSWEIARKCWHGLGDNEVVKKTCRLLFEYGWLIEVNSGGAGNTVGRPSEPTYVVSPAVKQKTK